MRALFRLKRNQWPKTTVRLSENRRWNSSWSRKVSSLKTQAYISTSHDPYLNLSIEHHLLQKSPADSVILFLYTNRPCIVIGRNQNPWSEVNLAHLSSSKAVLGPENGDKATVDLVRRRSGGGTVFHDLGNINWTVICSPSDFTRDKHAEMVTRALRRQGIERARVNQRHDIVLDQGEERHFVDTNDMHRTPFTVDSAEAPRALKVSGSAYKLTKGRALHHATALLKSPNLFELSAYLRAPARPYIHARGVESVSSPVANIGISNSTFIDSVVQEFRSMYEQGGGSISLQQIGIGALENEEIKAGWEEMHTPEWTFDKTPQFTLSLRTTQEDQRLRPALPRGLPEATQVFIRFRDGKVKDAHISFSHDEDVATREAVAFAEVLLGKFVRQVRDWKQTLREARFHEKANELDLLGNWLNTMLPDTFELECNQRIEK